MSTTAIKNRPAYDPRRQWGLKPEGPSKGADGEATYVIGGHVASSSSARGMQAPGAVAESIGREGQARARRQGRLDAQEVHAVVARVGKNDAPLQFGGIEEVPFHCVTIAWNAFRDIPHEFWFFLVGIGGTWMFFYYFATLLLT